MFILENIFIRFGTKLCQQIMGIHMDTNGITLVANLFLFLSSGLLSEYNVV